MERFWNLIHYFIYKAHNQFHLFCNKINPILFLYKLPFAKRHFAKKGINPIKEVNKAFQRPDIGLSSIVSGGAIYTLFFLLCFGVINIFSGIIQKELNLQLYHFIILIILSIIINYFLVFKGDKYLSYFKEFEKMEQKDKTKWAWISFAVSIGILFFIVGSFIFLNYRL
ncbi:hypothetical protein BZG02_03370 [Labilibaculum filiforme]|uniref:Uncharacterized protein n=1 Tax=Labilibaculum filiforme TaxID=1940526 RepID=A0A2N3I3M5_9BACT|nr:hypothetical protein [Labilibaculum filiforme]PKQ64901.1 hypothetical protein BZG02_03370 [Labilibaculum filiforme]